MSIDSSRLSAICIFRVSGSGCHCFLKQLFGRDGFSPNHFHVAVFKDGDRAIDQVGLVVFNGPKSYTGEDSFEVYAHGSLGIMSNIVKVFKRKSYLGLSRSNFIYR
mgnify:CR=1 FL=1